MSADMNLKIKVWRQKNNKSSGSFDTYPVVANEHMSFLEMLDVLNEDLVSQKKEPVAFDHDCREGICGTCSLVINGQPHGPKMCIRDREYSGYIEMVSALTYFL